jgi:hypothetical protein|tara:strand:+ start:208 stop:540 length:333 start_codon:yes stop_codon:yes gene_type:complete
MTINKWFDPDKIVESFMWYCYSKQNDEQIEDNLVEFREDMRSGLYKKLKRENPLPDPETFRDEEIVHQREIEIKKEVDKNDDLVMDAMVNKLRLGKDDWKKLLGIDLPNE